MKSYRFVAALTLALSATSAWSGGNFSISDTEGCTYPEGSKRESAEQRTVRELREVADSQCQAIKRAVEIVTPTPNCTPTTDYERCPQTGIFQKCRGRAYFVCKGEAGYTNFKFRSGKDFDRKPCRDYDDVPCTDPDTNGRR